MSTPESYPTPAAAAGSAAPAGGPGRGRGRAKIVVSSLCGLLLAGTAAAEATMPVALPSGREAAFLDFMQDSLDSGLTYRFRFVAPWVVEADLDFEATFLDMRFLCDDYALQRVATIGPVPSRIVVTLMSEPADFGVINPDVTQFFESFSLSDGVCIWEVF